MDRNPKYLIDTPENKAYLQDMVRELLQFAVHYPSPEGCAYYLRDDGSPWLEKNLDNYETCRMVHCYSIGKFLGFPGSDALIGAGLKGLLGAMRDKVNGGWYNSLNSDHSPLPGKQCYSHAFVILAASSALLAGHQQAQSLLNDALKCFEDRFWDETEGMTYDNYNTDFTVLDDYRGINANMHSVEALLAAADVTGDSLYRTRAGRIIHRVLGWAGENNWRIPEHYTKDWQPDLQCNADKPDDQFKPYGATPGHGLEWARLITQWALSTYPDQPQESAPFVAAAENLFHRAVSDGWNADGAPGIVYTTGWDGKPIVHDRMQWTLAEAINTAAVLYRVTGKPEYAGFYSQFLEYLEDKVHDHETGNWIHQLDSKNQKLETVWPGKPDIYHALQSMLIPYCAPELSVAVAVAQKKTSF